MDTTSVPSILELEDLSSMFERYTVLRSHILMYGIDRTTYTLAYNDLLRLHTLRLPSLEAYTYSSPDGAFSKSVIVSCEGFIGDIIGGIANFFVKLFTAIFDFFRGLFGGDSGGGGGGGGGSSGKIDKKANKVHKNHNNCKSLITEVKDQPPEFFTEAGKLCKKLLIKDSYLAVVWRRVGEATAKLVPLATQIKNCANAANMDSGKAQRIRSVLNDVLKLVGNPQKLFGDKSNFVSFSSVIHNADDAERYLHGVEGYVIDLVASQATTGDFQARQDLKHIEEILHEVQDQVDKELKFLQAKAKTSNHMIYFQPLQDIGKLILEFFKVTKAAAECIQQILDEIDQSIAAVIAAIKAALKAKNQQPGTASINLRSFYHNLTGASYV